MKAGSGKTPSSGSETSELQLLHAYSNARRPSAVHAYRAPRGSGKEDALLRFTKVSDQIAQGIASSRLSGYKKLLISLYLTARDCSTCQRTSHQALRTAVIQASSIISLTAAERKPMYRSPCASRRQPEASRSKQRAPLEPSSSSMTTCSKSFSTPTFRVPHRHSAVTPPCPVSGQRASFQGTRPWAAASK